MTYKLNPEVCKIRSPIVLYFLGEDLPERNYADGVELSMELFEKNYIIEAITATGNVIAVSVRENQKLNEARWAKADEKTVSFF